MYTPFYPFHWLAFEPGTLSVRGQHFPESLPVHPRLQNAFQTHWPEVRERILATPGGFEGGFEGDCAVLLHWEHEKAHGPRPAQLRIATGYRPYSQGHALKTVMLDHAGEHEPNALLPQPSSAMQPIPGLSWGSSLTTLVLLPDSRVLINKRSKNMQTNPSQWTCFFTEVLEPGDLCENSMQNVLSRLEQEELANLGPLGVHRFLGLCLLPQSYTWTLVSLLDLRAAPRDRLNASIFALEPDAETEAWGQHSLLPEATALVGDSTLLGLALAVDIVNRLDAGSP